jgi:hypothetical protein
VKLTVVFALALISAAAPVAADHTTDPSLRCVVVRQVGPLWNQTPDDLAPYKGIQQFDFPCEHDFYQALDDYLVDVKREQDENCPRCFPNSRPWGRR